MPWNRCWEPSGQILATWLNDSSTGVSRPKIETSTLSFWVSALISEIVAGRVSNGPVHDGDGLADLEVDDGGLAWLARGGAGPAAAGRGRALEVGRGQHGEDLVEAQRHRLVGVADEAGDARGVADGAPGLVGEVHPDQHVAGHPDRG